MVQKIFRWLGSMSEKRPFWVLAVIVLITVVAVFGLTRIKQEFGYKSMLPQNAESVRAMDQADKVFGGTTEEQVLVTAPDVLDGSILRGVAGYATYLQRKGQLGSSKDKVFATRVSMPLDDMVYLAGAAPAQSASTNGAVAATAATSAQPLMAKVSALTPEQLSAQVGLNLQLAAARSKNSSTARTVYISGDHKALLVNVTVNPELGGNEQMKQVRTFEKTTAGYFGRVPGAKVYVTGQLSTSADSSARTSKDTRLLFMLAFVFIVIVLGLTFRRLSDILLTLGVILVTVVWVMGLSGWLGFPFTYTSAAIIPLLLGIDIAYAIHVLSRYYEERRSGNDPYKSVLTSVVTVGIAVFLTAATTAFGFASFGISNMPPIQQFGALCVAGVLFSFVLAVTMLPASLVLRDRRPKAQAKWDSTLAKKQEEQEKRSWLDHGLARIAVLSEHHRVFVGIVTLVVLVGCLLLGLNVKTEADMQAMAPADMPSVVARNQVNKYFGGQELAYTLVKGDVLEPASLNAMLAYEDGLAARGYKTEKGVPLFQRDKMFSIADMVRLSAGGAIPTTKAQVMQVLLAMQKAGPGASQEALMNPKYPDVTMISIRTNRMTQNEMTLMAKTMRADNTKVMGQGKGLILTSSGFPLLVNDMLGSIVPTQLKTSGLALLLCALIVMLVFGSFYFGLAATSVVFLGIALEIGALVLLGWPLDFMSVMISSLVIGAGIDFGIHVTHRFREEWHQGGVEVDEAMRRTIGNVGKALVAAAVTTSGAFLIIGISRISYLQRFGVITALSLIFALLAALFVLPSILAWRASRVESKNPERWGAKAQPAD